MSWRALFHRIAVAQTVAGAADALPDAARIAGYATAFTPDAVQLAYQICVQGRADLALAPDEPTGFAMTLLRLLAFEPGAGPSAEAKPPVRAVAREAASTSAADERQRAGGSSGQGAAATRRSQAAAGGGASTVAGVRHAGRAARRGRAASRALRRSRRCRSPTGRRSSPD